MSENKKRINAWKHAHTRFTLICVCVSQLLDTSWQLNTQKEICLLAMHKEDRPFMLCTCISWKCLYSSSNYSSIDNVLVIVIEENQPTYTWSSVHDNRHMIYAFWIALLEEKCISYDKNNPMQWGEIRLDRQEKKNCVARPVYAFETTSTALER